MNVYDIALLKLMSASDSANHKDIYDSDYLTDRRTNGINGLTYVVNYYFLSISEYQATG
jgi:hypothetical protein